MRIFLFTLLLSLSGIAQSHSLQTSEDINLTTVESSQTDSLEVELTFHVKDLSAEEVQILLGPVDGSGEYGVITIEVKNKNGKKVLEEGGAEKALTNGRLVVRKRIPNEAADKDVHVQVNGKDKDRQNKYSVSRKVKLSR